MFNQTVNSNSAPEPKMQREKIPAAAQPSKKAPTTLPAFKQNLLTSPTETKNDHVHEIKTPASTVASECKRKQKRFKRFKMALLGNNCLCRKKAPRSPAASRLKTQQKNVPISLTASELKRKQKKASAILTVPEPQVLQKALASLAAFESNTQEKEVLAFPADHEREMLQKLVPASLAEPKMLREKLPASLTTSEPKMAPVSVSDPKPMVLQKLASASPTASEHKISQKIAPASLTDSEHKILQKEVPTEDEKWLKAIEETFESIAGEDRKISYDEFKEALDVKEEIFLKTYFQFFDEDNSGDIDMDEFMDGLCKISQQSDIDKLRFLFEIFDENGDGLISPEELKIVLRACVSESSLNMTDEKMDQLVAALLKATDIDGDGVITFDELKIQFDRYPMLLQNLTVSPSNWLKLHEAPPKPDRLAGLKKSASNLFRNNKPLLVFLIIHFTTFVACFISAAIKYRHTNGWVMVARGCGMSLNYHGAMLALSMARRSLTFLRNTPLGPYLPVDHHVAVHTMMGMTTVVLGLAHTVCHLANIDYRLQLTGVVRAAGSHLTYSQILFTRMSGIGLVCGTAYPTGVGMTIILLIIGICSQPIVRSSGKFELFYYSHLLYVPYWVLSLAHGPVFWMWFLVPGLMILLERIYSVITYSSQKKDGFYITQVNLLPSQVTHLVIRRPKSFEFHAGDYVFLRIPAISSWEWHPFTIRSAPEREGILHMHIKSVGNWTRRLYDIFATGEYSKTQDEPHGEDIKLKRQSQPDLLCTLPQGGKSITDRRKVFIDGPFGSTTVRMGDTNHAVLIATGIGVTPFASVLQSLLTQYHRTCAKHPAKHGNTLSRYAGSNKLKRIDLFWLTREADDFDWFITLLTQLEAQQNDFDHFLDMHLYMTAAKSSSDLKGVGLQMALQLVHQEAKQDMITGYVLGLRQADPIGKSSSRR